MSSNSPNTIDGCLSTAYGHYSSGQFELSLKYFNRCLSFHIADKLKHSEVYNGRGVIHKALHRTTEALHDYNQSIQFNSRNSTAFSNRGNLFILLRRYRDALADQNSCLALNSGDSVAYLNRAAVYFAENKLDLAAADYSTIIQMQKSVEANTLCHARYNLAIICIKLKKFPVALELLHLARRFYANQRDQEDCAGQLQRCSSHNNHSSPDATSSFIVCHDKNGAPLPIDLSKREKLPSNRSSVSMTRVSTNRVGAVAAINTHFTVERQRSIDESSDDGASHPFAVTPTAAITPSKPQSLHESTSYSPQQTTHNNNQHHNHASESHIQSKLIHPIHDNQRITITLGPYNPSNGNSNKR
jgi:hypothetical protein